MREPRRSALGLLAAAGAMGHPGARHTLAAFAEAERQLLVQAIASGCNSPMSSAVGRLFDAVASLLDLCQISSYEGEGALRLQGAAGTLWPDALSVGGALQLEVVGDAADPAARLRLDWAPLLADLLAALAAGPPGAAAPRQRALLAARFHQGLAAGFAELAERAAVRHGCRELVLCGGCFQNRLLLELTIAACRRRRLRPHWPAAVPANDGGLAVGQLFAAFLSA
jgi:hydrogenase maturation protein HypF